jgi:predicted ATPase
LNGSGKSTLLQAMDFVSQLMLGDIKGWLQTRNWESADLNSKLTSKSNIDFKIELTLAGSDVVWSGSFNRSSLSCTRESIIEDGRKLLNVEDGGYTYGGKRHDVVFEYEGSILSQLRADWQEDTMLDVKQTILHIRSLDLISPELLRSQSRTSGGKLGLGGEKLSAYIHELSNQEKNQLQQKLSEVYPQISNLQTKSLRSGWKQLELSEMFGSKKLVTNARHLNDGVLRLMAILLQLEIGNAFLLFDEIENGINPELVEFLVDQLVDSKDQVMVTTHSPMILNFIEDEVARRGVIYLYKNKEGHTKSALLFDIPSMAKKLEFMGPGEAFIDTDLTELYKEITSISKSEV